MHNIAYIRRQKTRVTLANWEVTRSNRIVSLILLSSKLRENNSIGINQFQFLPKEKFKLVVCCRQFILCTWRHK